MLQTEFELRMNEIEAKLARLDGAVIQLSKRITKLQDLKTDEIKRG